MNPIGNTGFMQTPPQGYIDYFNSLKQTPENNDLGHRSVIPLEKKKVNELNYLDLKILQEEANKPKQLPISYYTDKVHKGVASEPHHNDTIKKSTTPNVNIHQQKHTPKPSVERSRLEQELREFNAMRLEEGLGPISFEERYPNFIQTKVNMKLPKKTDSKGFPTGKLPSIAIASKNPTPNIKKGERGSIQNPIYSTDTQTSKPKAKPLYQTDAMGFPILDDSYAIGNVGIRSKN